VGKGKETTKANVCQACGYAATALNPLVAAFGMKIHQSHLTDKNSRYYQGR